MQILYVYESPSSIHIYIIKIYQLIRNFILYFRRCWIFELFCWVGQYQQKTRNESVRMSRGKVLCLCQDVWKRHGRSNQAILRGHPQRGTIYSLHTYHRKTSTLYLLAKDTTITKLTLHCESQGNMSYHYSLLSYFGDF